MQGPMHFSNGLETTNLDVGSILTINAQFEHNSRPEPRNEVQEEIPLSYERPQDLLPVPLKDEVHHGSSPKVFPPDDPGSTLSPSRLL